MKTMCGKIKARRAKYPGIEVYVAKKWNYLNVYLWVNAALRDGGVPLKEIERFYDEIWYAKQERLIPICRRWVTVLTERERGGELWREVVP